jgi:hypothetical protein
MLRRCLRLPGRRAQRGRREGRLGAALGDKRQSSATLKAAALRWNLKRLADGPTEETGNVRRQPSPFFLHGRVGLVRHAAGEAIHLLTWRPASGPDDQHARPSGIADALHLRC